MDVPWSRTALNRLHPSMELAGAEFNETEGEKLAISFNPAHADKLFAGSGHTFQELAELAKDRKPLAAFSPDRFHPGQGQSGKEGRGVRQSCSRVCRGTIRS